MEESFPSSLIILELGASNEAPCQRIQGIVISWNLLPHEAVMATNLDRFKRGLDKLVEEKAIDVYKP